jgi:hypothetical protein
LHQNRKFCRSVLFACVLAVLGACARDQVIMAPPLATASTVDGPLTVAFIGDQGAGAGARGVLQLIKAEGADLVLHQGDFDYRDDPSAWDALITEILGPAFPYFASVGNHDVKRYFGPGGYQAMLSRRLKKVTGARCIDELGILSACTYRNLFFVLSGIGTIPKTPDDPRHIAYIREKLAQSRAPWKICSWHKNQSAMQVGNKKDAVGWAAYETCREAGAMIATGHEHSYSRTHLMDHFEGRSIVSKSSFLRLAKGRSFAFVSGLGGKGIRPRRRGGPWWAAVHTKYQGAGPGALFCKFAAGENSNRARCYFKTIAGKVADRFTILNEGRKAAQPGS